MNKNRSWVKTGWVGVLLIGLVAAPAVQVNATNRTEEARPNFRQVRLDRPQTFSQLIVSFVAPSQTELADKKLDAVAIQKQRLSAISQLAGVEITDMRPQYDQVSVLVLAQALDEAQVQTVIANILVQKDALGIETVAPDMMRFASVMRGNPEQPEAQPNDTYYSSEQWDLQAVGTGNYGIDLPTAWDLAQGKPGVTVAVVDTGILKNHPDLQSQIPANAGYDFIDTHDGNVLVANDGGARDADASDPGDWITAAEASNSSGYFYRCGSGNTGTGFSASSWHGSHVAGTIAANSNNSVGITGINWNARILPIRVLGKCGGYDSDIIAGVRWAAGLAVSGVPDNKFPAKVINMSLGGYNSGCNPSTNPSAAACLCPAAWQTAVNEVLAKGTTIVVAAGNESVDAKAAVPANCVGVISVAATARDGDVASYSNYGASVTVAAPGGDFGPDEILSTVNGSQTSPSSSYTYEEYVGTSMAAPHVAGVASLLYALNPLLSPAQIKTYLQNNTTGFPATSSCTATTCGKGLLNGTKATQAVGSVSVKYVYVPMMKK